MTSAPVSLDFANKLRFRDTSDVQSPPLPGDHTADLAPSLSRAGMHKQLDGGCQPLIEGAEQSCQT